MLEEDVLVYTRVLDSSGNPTPDVLITFQEKSFNREIYSGFTDSQGRLDIRVPSVEMDVTLTPVNEIEAVTHLSMLPPNNGDELQWSLQKGTKVSGNFYYRNMPVAHALIELWRGDTIVASYLLNEDGGFDTKLHLEE